MNRSESVLGGLLATTLGVNVLCFVRLSGIADALDARPQPTCAPVVVSTPDTSLDTKILRDEIAALRLEIARATSGTASVAPATPRVSEETRPTESEPTRRLRRLAEASKLIEAFFQDLESLRSFDESLSPDDLYTIIVEKTADLLGLDAGKKAALLGIASTFGNDQRRRVQDLEEVFRQYHDRRKALGDQYEARKGDASFRAEVGDLEGFVYDEFKKSFGPEDDARKTVLQQLEGLLPASDPMTALFLDRVRRGYWINDLATPQPGLPWMSKPRATWVKEYAQETIDGFAKKDEDE